MMSRSKLQLKKIAFAFSLAFAGAASAANINILELPEFGSTIDNLPVNQVYDQGVVFSAKLLDQWQGYNYIPTSWGNYQFAMGTGTIPVVVYSGAGNPVTGFQNDSPFQNGMPACGGNGSSCSEFHGTWGLGSTATQYAGTIGALQQLLQGAGMMFAFDHNEGGSGSDSVPNIRATGRLAVYDGLNLIRQFAFDNTAGDGYHATDYVTACSYAVIGPGAANNFPCSIQAPTTHTYVLDANKGSGKPDFFILFPEFDLYSYNANYKIVVEMNMVDLDGGYEEMGIVGYRTNRVPEPAMLGLFGLGLLAIGGLRRRNGKA